MSLIDRECVRELLQSSHSDATLVFVRGDCVVVPATEVDDAHKGLIIASRDDIAPYVPAGPVTDETLDALAHCLDNIARDLGG
ncbi:hypothetical protein ABGB18_36625 [Nonomuraea sp. B12E4]|uniref:hypothetical protein n=1 Tax=Nonomuraea sp. B12E4 TaxID=3153564 RepID=UPI00325C4CB8